MIPPTDADLLERCRAREQGAWEALVDRYADLVYGIARRSGLDGPAGEDVVQDVFLRLLRSLERVRSADHLMGWIVTTARRAAWRAAQRQRTLRGRDRDGSRPERDLQPLPDTAVAAEERRHLVRRALDQLDARCRQLLDALFLRDVVTYRALSAELGVPVGSIGPTRARCCEKLVRVLARLGIHAPDVSTAPQPGSGGAARPRRQPSRRT
jgi:RNA polymerase sigma factor (sigma-70 family)